VQEYCHLPQELSKGDGSSEAAGQRTAMPSSIGSDGLRRGSGGGSGSAATSGTGRGGVLGSRRSSSSLREPLLPVAAAADSAAASLAAPDFNATEGRIEFSDVNLRCACCCAGCAALIGLLLHSLQNLTHHAVVGNAT
jgi:hypothetical protein